MTGSLASLLLVAAREEPDLHRHLFEHAEASSGDYLEDLPNDLGLERRAVLELARDYRAQRVPGPAASPEAARELECTLVAQLGLPGHDIPSYARLIVDVAEAAPLGIARPTPMTIEQAETVLCGVVANQALAMLGEDEARLVEVLIKDQAGIGAALVAATWLGAALLGERLQLRSRPELSDALNHIMSAVAGAPNVPWLRVEVWPWQDWRRRVPAAVTLVTIHRLAEGGSCA